MCKLDSFKDTIQKTIDSKAKVIFWLYFATRKIDQLCFLGTWPANFIAIKSQSSSTKNLRVEEPKVQTQKITFPYYPKNTKTSDRKTWKKKKKRHCHNQAQKSSISTSITKVHASSLSVEACKKLNQITY